MKKATVYSKANRLLSETSWQIQHKVDRHRFSTWTVTCWTFFEINCI